MNSQTEPTPVENRDTIQTLQQERESIIFELAEQKRNEDLRKELIDTKWNIKLIQRKIDKVQKAHRKVYQQYEANSIKLADRIEFLRELLHEDKIKKKRLAEHTKFVRDNSERIEQEKKIILVEVRTTKKLLDEGKEELNRKGRDLETAKGEFVTLSDQLKMLEMQERVSRERQNLISSAMNKVQLLEKNLSLALKVKIFYNSLKRLKLNLMRKAFLKFTFTSEVSMIKKKLAIEKLIIIQWEKQSQVLQTFTSLRKRANFREKKSHENYSQLVDNLKVKKIAW